VGEVQVEWAPHWPVPVLLRSGARSAPETDASPLSSQAVGPQFAMPLPATPASDMPLEVLARLPDGRLVPMPQGIARLSAQPVQARTSPSAVGPRAHQPGAHQPGAREGRITGPRTVDVVIPVYGAATETLRCLHSVFASGAGTAAEIIVVDDASPADDALSAALAQWAASGKITLLTNAVNAGFPATANRGMALHADRDIVLLNSDTEVFGDWLARLQQAAYASTAIGTVTPLGGRASIASYPDPDSDLSVEDACRVDGLAARVNAGAAFDVPVGVGFCLFVKRACLDAVGSFDAAAFGRGYGEENDLCLRASHAGWRHVVAADVFVQHSGGRSFGASQQALRSRNRHVLAARYPDYEAMVSAFHAADPLRHVRRALDFARLLDLVAAPVLLVTLALPGGVERHVDARRRSLEARGHTVLELRPASLTGEDGGVRLRIHAAHLPNLRYALPLESDTLRGHLLALKLRQVDVHHFLGLGGDVLSMITRLGVTYRVFVHDHSWMCPRVNLLSAANRYCGEPEIALCETCVRENGTALESGLTVAQLRARSADVLGRASCAIVPSADTGRRLARYFPTVPFEVEPWEIHNPVDVHRVPRPDGPVRIAVIGAIGIHKGYSVLLQCAADAGARDLCLEFVVIGHTHADDALLDTGRVFITGPYADDEVAALLGREACDLAWFPSVTPETWCYALTHALAAGLPVLAFDLGAIAERLRAAGLGGSLVPLDTPASRINDLLLHARADIVYKC
jgi:GT2 family glycosyltransferase/glycosyltransferase involved in cell wall biosynthesis